MSNDDTALTRLAGAILDGTPVDWDVADSGAAEIDRPLVRHLKAIAAIADAQRTETPDTWGPLRLLERIGQGAFGDVYRAWDPRLDREVALKLLPVEKVRSEAVAIIEEGRLLARVRHPNVVTIYGAERIDDRVGLWMEFIDGRTLHQLVANDGRRFSAREVTAIGEAVCGAVAAVHTAGLLHRDIKAQNVMMDRDGRVALMDFGTGRERHASAHAALAGTPLYLAPEMLSGSAGPSVQGDVYAIGVLLFFLLTGAYPVVGTDLESLRAAHARGERRSLRALRSDVPLRLARVVERAIDADPARRYATVAALSVALRRVATAPVKAAGYALAAAALALVLVWVARPPTPVAARGEHPQIAVIPLTSLSAVARDAEFAEGLTDEIIRNLGMVRGLDVRPNTSSSAFKGSSENRGDIGRQLGVDYVLAGSVARASGRLRIELQLVQVNGDKQVWAKPFERELTVADILSLQHDISREVVTSLRLSIDHPRRQYATNLDTYERYLRARALADRQGAKEPQTAVKLFEGIIAEDPKYAPAHAGLVLAYAYLSMTPYFGASLETAHPIMRKAAIEAIRLDPLLAESHVARGWVHAREFEWTDAERSFRRAIELNPGLIFSYTSFTFSTLQPLGRPAEAEALLREAERIDPYGPEVQLALGRVLLNGRKLPEAIDVLQRLRDVDSSRPFVELLLGRALALAGRLEESLPLLERRRERLLDPSSGVHPWAAFAYVKLGRRAEAELLAQQNDHLPHRRVLINAALGNRGRMFHGMEEMADREPQRLGQALASPELDPYRQEERFKNLKRRLRLEPQ